MRVFLFIVFLFLPAIVFAQNFPSMNQGDMQKMMEQAQKMQTCIASIDQGKIKALEERSMQIMSEIKSLCDSGKRDQAEKKAMSYGKEMKNDTTIKKMTRCSKMMEGILQDMPDMMPEMPFMEEEGEVSGQHVCDE